MLSMFCAASRPRIATEQHNNLEPLIEPQFDSRAETTASPTVFLTRRALGMAAMATPPRRDLGLKKWVKRHSGCNKNAQRQRMCWGGEGGWWCKHAGTRMPHRPLSSTGQDPEISSKLRCQLEIEYPARQFFLAGCEVFPKFLDLFLANK